MLKKLALTVALLWAVCGIAEEAGMLRPDHPSEYVVQRGDTLWDISGRFLNQPWRWPELWKANPQVRNPDLIYPGDRLVLSFVGGLPVLTVQPGEIHLGGRNYKRTPVVRDEPHADPVAAIPLDAIAPFLERPQVLADDVIETMPYVVSSQDQLLIAGPGSRIYVRGLPETAQVGERYTIFRTGVVYRDYVPDDPAGGEPLANEALYIGDAILMRTGDPATLDITGGLREVLEGDRVMLQERLEYPEFIPHSPASELEARVIAVIDSVSQVGRNQIVVLNKGSSNGLEPGNVLTVFAAGPSVRDAIATERHADDFDPVEFARADDLAVDQVMENFVNDVRKTKRSLDRALGQDTKRAPVMVTLPDEPTGAMMVFRVFDKVSYALILSVERPVRLWDAARTPTD